MTPFPWNLAMGLGLGVLRLSPKEFWAMSPRELSAAYEGLNGRNGRAVLGRDGLEQLMGRFPDG